MNKHYDDLLDLISGCIHHEARDREDIASEAQRILDSMDANDYEIAYPGDIVIQRDTGLLLLGALSTIDVGNSATLTDVFNSLSDTLQRRKID